MAEGDATLGAKIYREGISPSEAPLVAILAGGIEVEAAQFPCASCHRRSGFGSSEGGLLVPSVTGPALFHPTELNRADRFRDLYQELQPKRFAAQVRAPHVRPAYDERSLAAALREGHDPTGRALDPLMPRYRLTDEDLAHLTAYLHTLGARDDPGVDATTLHFATVVLPGTKFEERRTMLEMLAAYVRWKNTDTRNLLAHPESSPYHRDDFKASYRLWKLHTWELAGPSKTWPSQLEALYEERPVFALLSGLGGPWDAVHVFCEARNVPCLFPNTQHPFVESLGHHTLYFSRGEVLEAEVLARYLLRLPEAERNTLILIAPRDHPGKAPEHLLALLRTGGWEGLGSHSLGPHDHLPSILKKTLTNKPKILVLWFPEGSLHHINRSLRGLTDGVSHVLLPSTLAVDTSDVDLDLFGKLRFPWPYALPGATPPARSFRVRAWMRSRGLAPRQERIQFSTYFALAVADHALHHLVEHYSRDFFIEAVEHETENHLDPGVYPSLSLGPGQRFASKGGYVVQLKWDRPWGVEEISGWIVP